MRVIREGQRSQLGLGMIEVLIALLVLSIGVLGFVGLQLRAINQTSQANERVLAVLIAQEAIERLQLNQAAYEKYREASSWSAGEYGKAPPVLDCGGSGCSSDEIASWDTKELAWQSANQLPEGRIEYQECKFNQLLDCVIVSWSGTAPSECTNNQNIDVSADNRCLVLEVAK